MSYRFIGAAAGDWAGRSVSSAGDVDGDGQADLLIGARYADGGGTSSGEAYLLYGTDLAAADAVDGSTDGVIDLDNANETTAGGFAGYQFIGTEGGDYAGRSLSSAGDVDGDGQADLLIGAYLADGGGDASGEVYLLYGADLAAADAVDGSTDGVIDLDNATASDGAGGFAGYQFIGTEAGDNAGFSVSSAGDVDGDGLDDLLIGASQADDGGASSGEAYLLYGAQLAALDAADGSTDGVVDLGSTEALLVVGTAGNDTIDASFTDVNGNQIDNATVDGTDADIVMAGAGNDTVAAGAGDDTVYGDQGDDTLAGGTGDDWLIGGDGADNFSFADSFGVDSVSGGDGDDQIDLSLVTTNLTLSGSTITDGVNTVTFDTVESVVLGQGDDTATGSASAESLDGGAGADSLDGGDGADTLSGGDGADSVLGNVGADSLEGGADADTLSGGAGADSVYGGLGDDVFTVTTDYTDLFGDTIYGGDGNDTIDAGAIDDHIEILRTNQTDGSLNFYSGVRDGAGNFVAGELIGSTAFYGIESVTPCFTPGARVATPRGPVAVEDLRPGDQVLTRDNGAQPVAWVGCKTLPPEDLAAQARLRPVLIRAGALGHGLPERDMMFSPNHQILRADLRADLYFGEHEVLLAAKHLVGRPGITRALPKAGIAYVHFMFERHEVVLANGVWSESFQPGDQSLAGLDDDQRAELLTLFPALATQHGIAHYPAARRHPAPLRGPRPAGLKRGGRTPRQRVVEPCCILQHGGACFACQTKQKGWKIRRMSKS